MSIETNINNEMDISYELWNLKKEISKWTIKENQNPRRVDGKKRWIGNPEHRNWYQYNERGFVKWNYPFADILNPYQWVKRYSIKDVPLSRILPNISYKDLEKTWLEWPTKKLTIKNFPKDKITTNAIWSQVNNPCDVSCGKDSVHAIWLIKSKWKQAWDGQWLAQYKNPVYWLASHMKMVRDYKMWGNYLYRNRSIQWIICNGFQWFYRKDEDKSLKALRLIRISDACNKLNKNSTQKIQRNHKIDTMDKETLMAFTQLTAQNETWCEFTRATLERAYRLAFG